MRAIWLIAIGMSGVAQAAPIAVSCDTRTVTSASNAPGFPDGTKEGSFTYIFVIDDEGKTLKTFNPKAVSLDNWCTDCDIKFGKSEISYFKLQDTNRRSDTLATSEFKLDRVAGTVMWRSSTVGTHSNGRFSQDSSFSGPCKKVPVPKMTAPTAKF